MSGYSECYEEFRNNPTAETQALFLNSVNAISEKDRNKDSVQRNLRRMMSSLLDKYVHTGNKLYLEAFQKLNVCYNGKDAENRVINRVKYWLKHPFGRGCRAIGLTLSKSRYPSQTRKNVAKRFWKKAIKAPLIPFLAIIKGFRAIGKGLKNLKTFFYQTKMYRKYGYTPQTLRSWNTLKTQDRKNNPRAERSTIEWAHKHGFLYRRIWQYGLTEGNYKNFVSDRDYILINPVNNSYQKWIEDIPSARYSLAGIKEFLPEFYYHVLIRAGKRLFVRMPDCPQGYAGGDIEEALRLLRDKGAMTFRPDRRATGAKVFNFFYRDEKYYIASREVQESEIRYVLTHQKSFYVLHEYVEMREDFAQLNGSRIVNLRALIINRHVTDPHLVTLHISKANGGMVQVDPQTGAFEDGEVPEWEKYRKQLMQVVEFIPQLEYYAVNFKLTPQGICVISFNHHPDLLKTGAPNMELMEFLQEKVRNRRKRKAPLISIARIRNAFWKFFKNKFCAPGYRDFMLKEYVNGVINDFFTFRKTTLKQKIWCYKRGYYSFRLDQYKLTEENWDKFLSDRDYHWLCPINNAYQKWIDDKMTYRHVITPFSQYCPKYYYHIMNRNGESYALRMADCPEKYSSDFEGIADLLKDVGALAVKQSAGEHGDGFFKISYSDGKYYINHDESSREGIIERLKGLKRFYNVTEFLSMHPELKHIYPGSVNTVRVMVLNPTGCDPYIANAYIRIGTGSTKMTDNIGYGGVFAKVDIETGKYYGAERLNNHVIVPCPRHPDTDVLIEGTLPDWEVAKKALTDICNYFGQLEYLGFDVALSSEGVKILEINKYQDLHRCAFYGDTVQEFFKEKIEEKKRYKLPRK